MFFRIVRKKNEQKLEQDFIELFSPSYCYLNKYRNYD